MQIYSAIFNLKKLEVTIENARCKSPFVKFCSQQSSIL